jgi:hypothetical protein
MAVHTATRQLTGSEPVNRKGIPWSAEAEMNRVGCKQRQVRKTWVGVHFPCKFNSDPDLQERYACEPRNPVDKGRICPVGVPEAGLFTLIPPVVSRNSLRTYGRPFSLDRSEHS